MATFTAIAHDRWTELTFEMNARDEFTAVIERNSAVVLGAPRLIVGDDTIAAETSSTAKDVTIKAADIPACTVVVPVKAQTPITVEGPIELNITWNDGPVEILKLEPKAPVRLLPQRCRWVLPKAIPHNEPTELRIRVRNDGGRAAKSISVMVPYIDGLHLEGNFVPTRDSRGDIVAQAKIDDLAVGASADFLFTAIATDAALQIHHLYAELTADDGAALTITHDLPQRATYKAALDVSVPTVAFGVGERIPIMVKVSNDATPGDARLVVGSDYLETITVTLSGLAPGEKRVIPIHARVQRADNGQNQIPVEAILERGDTQLASASANATLAAAAAYDLTIDAKPADKSAARWVMATIRNVGLADGEPLTFRLELPEGVVAVRDTLVKDAVPLLTLDGSSPLADGVPIQKLASQEHVTVAVRVRAAKAGNYRLNAAVASHTMIVADGRLDVDLPNGSQREPEVELVGEALDPAAVKAAVDANTVAPARRQPASAAATVETHSPVVYPDEITATYSLFIPSPNVVLGQWVLGMYDLIPVTIDGAADDLQALRHEIDRLHSRAMNGVKNGTYGVTGYFIADEALGNALNPVLEHLGRPTIDATDEHAVIGALLDIADLQGHPTWVRALCDNIRKAVDALTDDEGFGDVVDFESVAA
jgi:hypothetical protein